MGMSVQQEIAFVHRALENAATIHYEVDEMRGAAVIAVGEGWSDIAFLSMDGFSLIAKAISETPRDDIEFEKLGPEASRLLAERSAQIIAELEARS